MISFFSKRSDIWQTLFLVGIGSAIAGCGAAWLSFKFYGHGDPGTIYLIAPLVALLIGPLFWWCFIIKARRLSIKRGILVGVVGSIVAHPLTWFLMTIPALLKVLPITVGGLVTGFLATIEMSLVFSVYSLLTVGIITVLVGGIAGGIVAALQLDFHCQERWDAVLSN